MAAVLAGAVAVIGPRAVAFRSAFIAWPPPVSSAIGVGDHLQTAYNLWLWAQALATLRPPWIDPFQFAGVEFTMPQPFGWPLVLVSVPVQWLFGPVAAYNALVLLAFPACALAAAALARQFGASIEGAALAGVAFAFAPFRLVQAATHINALLAFLFPLILLTAERALRDGTRRPRPWAWACTVVFVSVVLSGELHLAIFATAMLAMFVLARAPGAERARLRAVLVPSVALVALTALAAAAIYFLALGPSTAGEGRAIEAAAYGAPRFGDLVTRSLDDWRAPTFERYAYPGVAILICGLVGAIRGRGHLERPLLLGFTGAVPLAYLLALAPGWDTIPVIQRIWHSIPFFSFTRVPGRILILSSLALAVLAAFSVQRLATITRRGAVLVACVAILLDAPAELFARNPAGQEALAVVPRGSTVLHLPPFNPGHFSGTPYTFLITQVAGPTPNGYGTFLPDEVYRHSAELHALADPSIDDCRWLRTLDKTGTSHVALHQSLFGPDRLRWPTDGVALAAALDDHPAFVLLDGSEPMIYRVDPTGFRCGEQ